METPGNDSEISENEKSEAIRIAEEITASIWDLRKLHLQQVELNENYADRRFELAELTREASMQGIGQFIVDFTSSPQTVVEGSPGTGTVINMEAHHFIADSDSFEMWGVGVNSGQILLRNKADDTWVSMDSGVGFAIRPYIPGETKPLKTSEDDESGEKESIYGE